MANFNQSGKWKKRTVTGLALALSAVFTLGIFTACANETETEEDEDTAAAKTDTQLIKNGDFEFYGEMTKELEDKRAFLNTPNSWSLTAGSPSSDTQSGLINADEEEFKQIAKSSFSLISSEDTSATNAIAYAVANWDKASVYDRLEFYDKYSDEIDDLDSSSDAAKLFAEYNYSIDFEDVEKLDEELGGKIALHDDENQREAGDTGVLMIHNQRTSDNVRGTGQYYTSSTTVTLDAGTAAKVSVWVKTSNLYHYYADNSTEVTKNAGAYIGVTHTVGGTTLDQMQIKNINTRNVTANNGWEQFTVYIRANTFATSTFKIVLGLGQGSTTDRYEQVDGYAFFDDLECTIIPGSEYESVTSSFDGNNSCDLDSKKADKLFDATQNSARIFALDLYAGDNDGPLNLSAMDDGSFALTQEVSGSNTYTSASISSSLSDNRSDSVRGSVTKLTNYAQLEAETTNGYLRSVFENDFKDKFPFASDSDVVMLLSSNGAAYTATLPEITLEADSRMLVSFFVKTSEIISGRSGATITLVDGENKTQISAFDSTTLDTVDIDNNNTEDFNVKDIYKGWAQCFFFVTNDNDSAMTFHLELSFGPTTIVGTSKSAYGQGYAAFTNFQTRSLTKKLAGYASTGDRAKNVSLTGVVTDSTMFDTASATTNIEDGLANPSRFAGVSGGSRNIVSGGGDNVKPATVYAGLLNSEYASDYQTMSEPWVSALDAISAAGATDWWSGIFGANDGRVARQPLVILNTGAEATASYGYIYRNGETVSANSYQRISMRVKAAAGTTAYLYLTDTSDVKEGFDNRLSPNVPKVTYWYDDEGNICAIDPSDKNFSKRTDVLYTLEENGLYLKEGATDGAYYANLWNYETNGENLVTADGTIAFYGNEGKYYAYYDEEKNVYSQEVFCLPKTEGDKTITRYDYTGATMPECVIAVEGTGEWVDVAFYVHTGNEAKSYRLEVWAGERTNATNGIPAGGYVFFDQYSSASASNYDTLLSEAVSTIKESLNAGKNPSDESYLGAKDNLPAEYALYYTFTFFDSTSYLRYDVNEDADEAGNPYSDYAQSAYSEQIVFLLFDDLSGEDTGTPFRTVFLDYGATDVTVEKSTTSDDSSNTDTTTTSGEVNVWLILSSSLLGVVLVFAIVALIVRRVWKKHGRKTRVKAPKAKRVKPEPVPESEPEQTKPKRDQNDPYNE